MKSRTAWLVGAALVWCLAVTTAAAEGAKPERGTECAAQAEGFKGAERERAIEACLKEGEASPLHPQQSRMKACNVEAGRKELRGEERRAFMSSCLKSK